jgi:hypothetical protein
MMSLVTAGGGCEYYSKIRKTLGLHPENLHRRWEDVSMTFSSAFSMGASVCSSAKWEQSRPCTQSFCVN